MVRVFFSVGDTSGDMYAAEVAKALKRVCPDWQLEGIGGSEMLKAGVKLRRYTTPFSAFGFWSSVQNAIRFWFVTAQRIRLHLLRNPPDLFVPVDLGAFNRPLVLPLAQKGVKVFYFVPPSFWGVPADRLKKYAHPNIVFAPIYDWQRDKLKQAGAQVIEFGHPLIDILRPYLEISSSDARTKLRLPLDKPVIGLFPGSRLTTVRENLPLLLQTAELLIRSRPDVYFAIGLPEGWQLNWVKSLLERYGRNLPFSLLFGQSRVLLRACDVAILVAGTVTLEAACLGTPSVAVFRMGLLNRLQVHWLRWKGINVFGLGPFALPNRILGEIVMPEFIGWMAKPERIAVAIEQLLADTNQRERIQHRLTKVWDKLGEPKVGLRIANFLVQWLVEKRMQD